MLSPQRRAVAGARDVADRAVAVEQRLLADEHDRGVVGDQAAQLPRDAALLDRGRGLAADEVRVLAQAHGPARGRPRRGRAPRRCPGPRAGSPSPGAASRRRRRRTATAPSGAPASPQRVPQPAPELGRRVDLPAQLADVGHAQRAARHVADVQRPARACRAAPRWRGRRRCSDADEVARQRAPHAQAAQRRGEVGEDDRAVVGQVAAHPGDVVAPDRAAGDDPEAVLAQARDRQVAHDPAARREHRRVDDRRRPACRRRWPPGAAGRPARPGPLTSTLVNGVRSKMPDALAAGAVLGLHDRRPEARRPLVVRAGPRRRSAARALASYHCGRSQPALSKNSAPSALPRARRTASCAARAPARSAGAGG